MGSPCGQIEVGPIEFIPTTPRHGPPGRKAIVYGQDSKLFDDDSADYLRECGATDLPIIGIPGARHHLMLDEPIALVSTLRSIVAQWHASNHFT